MCEWRESNETAGHDPYAIATYVSEVSLLRDDTSGLVLNSGASV